jgi:spore protease
MSKFSPYTDLALEAAEAITEDALIRDGIEVKTDDYTDISVTSVKITDEGGANRLNKPIGTYITIESPKMRESSPETHEEIKKLFAERLSEIASLDKDDSVLVVGLGNRYVTPDSLGPKVISGILVTRHISETLPDEIRSSVRSVAAVTPGVMGLTGIESAEIIKGITEKTKPSLIIAIDALAARKASRINATVQMSDTGVTPGAGVGNTRGALNKETLGVPVIAVGVPTVVNAATLVNDSLDSILSDMIKLCDKGSSFYNTLNDLSYEEKYSLISACLDPYTENMFVTPKEVDSVVDTLADIISSGINMALHPSIDVKNVHKYSV